MVAFLPLGALVNVFYEKDEIGASLAIEVQKNTPEESKLMSDLKKSNEDVDAANLASSLVLNPREFRAFWTPREKNSKRFTT